MRTLVVTLIATLMTACSTPGSPETAASPSPTLAVAPTTRPAATVPPASTSARPSTTPLTELPQVFRPLATGWRPTGPTLVIGRTVDSGESTLVAVSLEPGGRLGESTPIVGLAPGSWALRPDGGAVVIGVGPASGRLALWDIRSGEARWLTTAEAGGGSPVWSKDGSTIYYTSTTDDGKPGLFQIRADGSGRKQLFSHERLGQLDGLTPDGSGLVWTRGQAGGSVDIVDIPTGVNRHLADNARLASWRAAQPRLLLSDGWCCAGGPSASLVAWDDVAMTSRVMAAIGPNGDPAWGAAAWEPSGTRIAAIRYSCGSARGGSDLVVLDPATGASQPIAANVGGQVFWLNEGVVFSTARAQQPGFELKLSPSQGGSIVSLYEDSGYIQRIDVIRP